jgi:hypothetical protein
MYVESKKYQIRYACRKMSNTLCMVKNIQHAIYVEKYQIRYVCRKISNTLCM